MSWIVEFLDEDVEALVNALPTDMQAHLGLERVHEPYIKHLEAALWEMRLKGKSGIARAVYVPAVGKRIVVVHVFTKKTPRREIEIAPRRAKEVQ